MGTAEAATAAISGVLDKFDLAAGVITWIEKLVDESEAEVELHRQSLASELFGAESKAHFYDPRQDWKMRLAEAREKIREAELICQQVLAEIP
jgi:hypothetical protein